MGDKIKEEINNLIKFLEKYLNETKLYIKNNEFLSDISLTVKNNIILLRNKSKVVFVKISRYAKNKYHDIKEYLDEKEFIKENKKTFTLSALCLAGGLFTFLLSFNGDLFRVDVNAEDSAEICNLSNSSNLEFPTLSVNGQRFATDAKIIEEKLNSYDFYNNGKKVVYLTFDDGPSKYSKDILNVLKKYNVRATFFTTGTSIENSNEELNDVLRESYTYGNSIGNHTYSHDYNKLYPSKSLNLKAFQDDLDKNLYLLKNVLGEDFETNVVRCPGGSMSWNNMDSLKKHLDKSGKAYIDWNSLTGDSSSKNKDINTMIENAITTSKDKNLVVLLMHETNKLTSEYLDDIIKYYHSNGYEFKTLA